MKKAISVLFALALLVFLQSCGGESQETDSGQAAAPARVRSEVQYSDGICRVTYDSPDARGWRPELEIQVRGGMVVTANFDYVNLEGAYKSQDIEYAASMSSVAGITPQEAFEALITDLIEYNDGNVDTVTGATSSSRKFREMAQAALAKAVNGDTTQTILATN